MTDFNEEGTVSIPPQSPLFHAAQAARYERQSLIRQYEGQFDCRLIVLIDAIFPYSVTLFEDLIYDASADSNLHLLLASPGGDGETAVRLLRAAQARCNEFTVIVPDAAKSAATLLAVGAHHIVMAPTSDLGPIDPQFFMEGKLVAAKDIIAAVDDAASKVQAAPETYPLHASLLSNVDAIAVQQSRSALDRTEDLLKEALQSHPGRTPEEVDSLSERLKTPLITGSQSHAALFGLQDALSAGLPVQTANLQGEQWQMLWRLWAKYYGLGVMEGRARVYEGRRSSWVLEPAQ